MGKWIEPLLICLLLGVGAVVALVSLVRDMRHTGKQYARLLRDGVRVPAVVKGIVCRSGGDFDTVFVLVCYTAADGVERTAEIEWKALGGAPPTSGATVTVLHLPGAPTEVELEANARFGMRL